MSGSNSDLSRRSFVRSAGLGACALTGLTPSLALAGAYPNRPVLIIVPFAAGGSADVYARLLAPPLEKMLGQPFLVDDRPGTAAILGTKQVQISAPDGYTLLIISNTHTVNETLYQTKPYKLMDDFVPVAPINSSDLVLVTRPGLGAKTVADIISMAKAKPGRLTYASSGSGTPYHMAGELFKQMAGIDILHVPYKGSSPARMDVIGSQIDMMFDATTTMTGFIASGQVTAIGTSGIERSAALPNLPPIAETIPGYTALIWLGVVAPKGTPTDIVAKLNATIATIAKQREVVDAWQQQGAVPMLMEPQQFTDYIAADIVKWAKVVQDSGASVK
jgi:tripartite-type tricarboxylate transporter receptor subunit TctC